VGLEWGPLSLVSTIEELLERKNSGSGLERRECGRRDPWPWPRDTLYPQTLALTSLTSDGPSVGIVLSRTQTTEFFLVPEKTEPFNSLFLCFSVAKAASFHLRLLESRRKHCLLIGCVHLFSPIRKQDKTIFLT
jgi:hypothetical protein